MNTTYRNDLARAAEAARILVDFSGTVELADAVRIIAKRTGIGRAAAADGIRLAVNRRRIRTLRLPAGAWAIGRGVSTRGGAQ